jgi:hypothetical protein
MTRREKKKKKLDAQKKKLSFMPSITTNKVKPNNQNPKASNNIA